MHPKVLTIAGSDSGGGAGIQADLKTFTVLKTYGLSVITALTAQNTLGVRDVLETNPDFVEAQLQAVLADIGADAAKTGMLASAETVEVVARAIEQYGITRLVVDPVMVSKSGHHLLRPEAVRTLRDRLLPLAAILTPNTLEASVLTGSEEISSLDDMKRSAEAIWKLGCRAVLLKGGHLGGETSDDLWFDGKVFQTLPAPRLSNRHTHGTGCTLSAAIAAFLARGLVPLEAVRSAKEYLTEAIRRAQPLGAGIGPVDHLWPLIAGE
ncbi:bifunctional hydroxymethylpyrimidine kinase/phosphomethylpyrimidine kinase [bacterium]|nr:bifunctional hydroxymethylpyrimidine kinase/phosphomethylpyrimidine kinase [bacterium]